MINWLKNPQPSKRMLTFPPNPIRSLEGLALKAEKQGVKIFYLNIGAPDTPTPLKIRQASANYVLKQKSIRYGPSAGSPKLIEQIIKFYKEKIGINGLEPKNILITSGASEGLELAMLAVADHGQEILTPDPVYHAYRLFGHGLGVKMKPIKTKIEDGFHIIKKGESKNRAMKRISRLVTAKTRAILWSSPGNPTGTVFSKKELKVFKLVAAKHGLYLIADEVYGLLTFKGGVKAGKLLRAPSIFDVVSLKQRKNVLLLNSSSKMVSFCGARIGILIVNENIAKLILKKASSRGCASVLGQAGLEVINSVSKNYFIKNRQELKARRDFLHSKLLKMAELGIKVSKNPPEGAFYIVVDLGESIVAADFCRWLLKDYWQKAKTKESLFLTPMRVGEAGFYLKKSAGESQVRIAYVLERKKLQRSLDILADALKKYPRKTSLFS